MATTKTPGWQRKRNRKLQAHQALTIEILHAIRPTTTGLEQRECLGQLAAYVLAMGADPGAHSWEEFGELSEDYYERNLIPRRLYDRISRFLSEWV